MTKACAESFELKDGKQGSYFVSDGLLLVFTIFPPRVKISLLKSNGITKRFQRQALRSEVQGYATTAESEGREPPAKEI